MNYKNILLAVLLFGSCKATAGVSQPAPKVSVGFTFNTPCQEHGQHVQTVTGSSLGYIYTITSDTGDVVTLNEENLLTFFEQSGIVAK